MRPSGDHDDNGPSSTLAVGYGNGAGE